MLRSRTVDDVAAALTRWVEPVNSAVVADTRGEMRHLVVGRVPRRHADNLVGPVPAWDGRHRWEGWMPNPVTTVTDVMVSANDRAAGGGLGVEYASPFRAMRIRELIGDRDGLDVADSATIQVDTLNGQAAPMRELVASVELAALTPEATAVRSELLAWDGHSGAGSHGVRSLAQRVRALVLAARGARPAARADRGLAALRDLVRPADAGRGGLGLDGPGRRPSRHRRLDRRSGGAGKRCGAV